VAPVRSLYLGELDGIPCRSAELPEDHQPPPGMAFRPLRDLYGRIDEHLWTLAGRAAQLVEWDRTHVHCGRCGTPTEHAPGERARRCPVCGHAAFPRL
jgi:NAD+ diphosphatase